MPDHDPTVAGFPVPLGGAAWRIARPSLELILDMEEISRQHRDHDLLDCLIFAAILAANLAPVVRDPRLQLAYATIDEPAPDDLRRPVSINAVAASLRLPFETARRRIRGMVREGLVADARGGVFVPNSTVGGPAFMASMLGRHARLEGFYRDLRAAGVLPPPQAHGPAAATLSPPVRVTNRAAWEYMLRACDSLIAFAGDVVSALVFLGAVRENTRALGPRALAAWLHDPLGGARPTSTLGLAHTLNLSGETCRRYVIALERAGLCRRTAKGVLAVIPHARRPELARVVADNLANVQLLFARLGQLGVLDAWEPEPLRATG